MPGILVHAQEAQLNILVDSGTSLIILPEMPGPNASVDARLESSAIDLDVSNIVWSLNGAIQKSGRGEKTFTFTTGSIGSRLLLTATINSPNGVVTKIFDYRVGSVDILWEGAGYVPPFYEGKNLWSKQGFIRFLAVPNLPDNPSTLIYQWSVNGEIVGNSSGTGKNAFILQDSILGLPRTVKVAVLKDQNTKLAEGSITLSASSPYMLVYENNPLYGFLFNKALAGEYQMGDKETTLTAFPLFFSINNRQDTDMGYSWSMNGGVADHNSSVTYRAPDTGGSSNITLRAQSVKNILQTVSANFQIKFGQ